MLPRYFEYNDTQSDMLQNSFSHTMQTQVWKEKAHSLNTQLA
jgi:hypothetical protein